MRRTGAFSLRSASPAACALSSVQPARSRSLSGRRTDMRAALDTVVVGAGPAGLAAAEAIASQGLSVLVIERKAVIGEPVRCGELIRRSSLACYADPDGPFVVKRFDRYTVAGPCGARVTFTEPDLGRMIDRAAFDRHLAARAEIAGASIATDTVVDEVSGEAGAFILYARRGGVPTTFLARTIVAADGVASRIARLVGIKTATGLRATAAAAFGVLHAAGIGDCDPVLRFGSDIAPGGYGWLFPTGAETANIGVGLDASRTAETATEALARLATTVAPAGRLANIRAGAIPITRRLQRASTAGLIVVGDAARTVNPLTGAGIAPALASGRLGGMILARALHNGSIDGTALSLFDATWHADHGAFHRRSLLVRRYLDRLSDEVLDRAIGGLPPEIPHTSVAEDVGRIMNRVMFRNAATRGRLEVTV